MVGEAHSHRNKHITIMAANRKRILQTEFDDDADQSPHFVFKSNETFAKFLVIQSLEEKSVTSLSPFVTEKQIESLIGTPKSVKKQNSSCGNMLKISNGQSFENFNLFWIKSLCHGA